MSDLNQARQLMEWLKAFKSQCLQNEDEVETKFVIPLFQKLGYRDEFYRGKYSIGGYSPGKKGRKPESDRVYFSVGDLELQDRKTSLIVIEAKEPKITKLNEAIRQAEYYETHLKPIFLVATNGRNIIVIHPERYTESQTVFNLTIEELSSKIETAKNFYDQLNFEAVNQRKKEYQAGTLSYEKYALLDRSLRNHPELPAILEQGELEPEIIHNISESRLRIVKPKISIECELPILLKEGFCEIEFSNILRRGLKIRVNHQYILGKFMIGLGTSPNWGTRSFIKKVSEDAFKVVLGESSTTLSRMEVEDLCLCVDEICQKYKAVILDIETSLKAEKHKPVDIPSYCTPGFHLLSVQQWFWDLMKKFSEEQYQSNDESEWDIFDWNSRAIRIGKSHHISALLYPVHSDSDSSNNLLRGYVDIVYALNNIPSPSHFSRLDKTPWRDDVGPKGIWTIDYTKNWLVEKLIPKVEERYSKEVEEYYWQFSQNSEQGWYRPYISNEIYINRRIPLEEVSEPEHLAVYLSDVHSWIGMYDCNLDASLLRPYYRTFVELCKQADFSTAHIDYLIEKLDVGLHQTEQKCNLDFLRNLNENYVRKDLIANLISLSVASQAQLNAAKQALIKIWQQDYVFEAWDQHLERINDAQYESSSNADLMSRSFIAVIQDCEIRFSQAQLNAAKQALIPLWQQSQFEERYVAPNR